MEFRLPDIGEGVHEGEIIKWLVSEGSRVEEDQPLVEVMTDKATVEIPSPVQGNVKKLHAKEGGIVKVGNVLLEIDEAQKKTTATIPEKEASSTASPILSSLTVTPTAVSAAPPPREEDIFKPLATPATRKLARDLNIPLSEVQPTGPKGRITKMDVQMHHEQHQAGISAEPNDLVPLTTPSKGVSTVDMALVERVPLKGIRKKIAESMSRAKHTAAHFTFVEEVDMTEIVMLRKGSLAEAEHLHIKLTFLPFIIKALIATIRNFPFFNASLDDEKQEILIKKEYNIGIAVDTPSGLMVPVIHHADTKSIWQLAREIMELSVAAREGKIKVENLRGGTFTVTNAGSIGGLFATPVINHPEVAILGVNSIRKRPMVLGDEIKVRDMMYLSLSIDHRVIDGADAARFMNQLIFYLSEPKRLVFA